MIHNVPIVFGQEKASTPDISNLDSKFYLHGMKSLRGWGTTHPWRNHHDYQEICNHGGGGVSALEGGGISILAGGYNHRGVAVSLATAQKLFTLHCPIGQDQFKLIKNLKGGTI